MLRVHLALELLVTDRFLGVVESLQHPFAKLLADANALRAVVGDGASPFAEQAVLLESLRLDFQLDHAANLLDHVVEDSSALAGSPLV